jgi:hypothetical protein
MPIFLHVTTPEIVKSLDYSNLNIFRSFETFQINTAILIPTNVVIYFQSGYPSRLSFNFIKGINLINCWEICPRKRHSSFLMPTNLFDLSVNKSQRNTIYAEFLDPNLYIFQPP